MNSFGPRILIKTDGESSIGRGCVEYAYHYTHQMADIKRAAAASAPIGAKIVRFTEGYRDIRRSADDHEEFHAFDITVDLENGHRADEAQLNTMAWRMKLFLGPDYGFLVHGERSGLHIHFRFKRKG